MKTKKLLFISLFLFSCFCYGQNLHRSDYNLTGNVESISEVSYLAVLSKNQYVKKTQEWEYNWQYNSTSLFDSLGNTLSQTYYHADSSVSHVDKYTYNNGKIQTVETKILSFTYQYNENGKLLSVTKVDRSPTQSSVLEASSTLKEIVTITEYSYNNEGLLGGSRDFNENDETQQYSVFFYSDDGKLIQEDKRSQYYKEKCEYTYDSLGNLSTKKFQNCFLGVFKKHNYIYQNSILTQETIEHFALGKLDSKVVKTFENGNIKDYMRTNKHDEIDEHLVFQYKYDSSGNWIQKIYTTKNNIVYIVERDIKYFD